MPSSAKRRVKVATCWRTSTVVGATQGHLAPCQGRHRGRGGAQRHLGLCRSRRRPPPPAGPSAGRRRGRRSPPQWLHPGRASGEWGKRAAKAPVGGGRRRQNRGGGGLVALAGARVTRARAAMAISPPDALAALRPGAVVEPVEPDGVARATVAPQPVQGFHGGEQVGVLGVVEPHRVARPPAASDAMVSMARNTPTAVVDVDHRVADGELPRPPACQGTGTACGGDGGRRDGAAWPRRSARRRPS